MTALVVIALLLGGWLYTPDKDRAQLEAQYAQPPSEFIAVNGLRLHVRDTGPRMAPAVLLLHGFGASLHTWDVWAQVLEQTHRVIRLDLPGAGLTGADPSGDYSDERGVQIIATLLDELDVANAVVVGHSMGGRLAWRLAAEQPHRVSRLVLIAADGFSGTDLAGAAVPDAGGAARWLPHVLPKALLAAALRQAYADPTQLIEPTLTRYHDLLLAPGVRRAILARQQQLRAQDPEPWLARITAPTLLMWGEQDRVIPARHADDFRRALPRSESLLLPAVGHLPHEEAPTQSLQAVQNFLR